MNRMKDLFWMAVIVLFAAFSSCSDDKNDGTDEGVEAKLLTFGFYAEDPYLAACYPNVEQGTNKGVILEIRRERTIELVMEGLRQWDLFRWKEGKQMFNHYVPYYGIYVPGVGTYDMDGDGKPDLEIYETTATSQCDNKKKLDKDIYLSNGTSGYIIGFPKVTYGKDWKEERDYLWPIPADQRVLTQGILTQNPGWEDGLSY